MSFATVRDDDGLATAKQLTEDRLRYTLAQLADWRRHTKKDGYVPAHPPAAVVKSILATPDPSLSVLAGITTTPVFSRGGELLTEPGYHAGVRLLYDPPLGFVLPAVPAKPTPSDIAAARQLLVNVTPQGELALRVRPDPLPPMELRMNDEEARNLIEGLSKGLTMPRQPRAPNAHH
jgi:hypothetical protein